VIYSIIAGLHENGLNSWQEENAKFTKESCHQLLVALKQHLDPVLSQLRGKDGAQVSFAQIMANVPNDPYVLCQTFVK